MSVIILLAVGADYNLLLVARIQGGDPRRTQHRHHPRHGRHRLGGHLGRPGLRLHHVSMSVSELRIIGQVGTTIGLGLLFDTLVVRSLMTPSIAALMGKWFWWPQSVRQRPVP
ncbi:MMPL family transporter [Mycolicibacterium aubagnense]